MSASVMNGYQVPLQFSPGMQPATQDHSLNVNTLETMANVLGEIAQLLQSAQQSNPASGQPATTGTTSTTGGTTQSAGGQQFNAQSAAGALASYASANGMSSMDPNALYQLAYNPPANATPTDSAAAKWMLQNPGVFQQIETHDVAGSDGIAGVNDLQWAAQGGLGAARGGTGGTGGTGTPTGGTTTGSGLSGSTGGLGGGTGNLSGLGALGSLLGSLESSLSGFGNGSSSATPTAGGFGGAGGGSGLPTSTTGGFGGTQTGTPLQMGPGPVVQQPQQQGGASQMNAQSAAGALSAYSSANGISAMDPNALYKLAYNPPANATPTDSAAAKWMLQNPDTFNKIETHDVAGSDGLSGNNNFQWAAQGGLGNTGGTTTGTPAGGTGTTAALPTTGGFGGTPTTLPATNRLPLQMGPGPVVQRPLQAQPQTGGVPMNAQSAAGALSAYASANGISATDPNELYKLAYNPPANATPTDSAAAKFMLQNSGTYNTIETHDVAGSDGISGVGNLQWAAQGGMSQTNPV